MMMRIWVQAEGTPGAQVPQMRLPPVCYRWRDIQRWNSDISSTRAGLRPYECGKNHKSIELSFKNGDWVPELLLFKLIVGGAINELANLRVCVQSSQKLLSTGIFADLQHSVQSYRCRIDFIGSNCPVWCEHHMNTIDTVWSYEGKDQAGEKWILSKMFTALCTAMLNMVARAVGKDVATLDADMRFRAEPNMDEALLSISSTWAQDRSSCLARGGFRDMLKIAGSDNCRTSEEKDLSKLESYGAWAQRTVL